MSAQLSVSAKPASKGSPFAPRRARRHRATASIATAALALSFLPLLQGTASAVSATALPATQAAEPAPLIATDAAEGEYGAALQVEAGTVTGSSFVTRPSNGVANAVLNGPLSGFPRSGGSAVLLTSGDARLAPQPNVSSGSGVSAGGGNVRGNSDFDVTVLRVDLNVPADVNCLVGFDFRFLSEEFPEFVGSGFNDAFIAELDKTTWTTNGSTISAPDNFAFDPAGNVISINSSGATSMSAAEAEGTTYDGATPLLSAATPITPGAHSLFLSIFDQGDSILDSAVLIDNLLFGTVNNVATDCKPGAVVSVDGLGADALLGAGNPASNISVACAGDPINCATGNFYLTRSDVTVPGRNSGVALTRTYNSLAATAEGSFGRGWASTLDMAAVPAAGGDVLIRQENGSTIPFKADGGGFTAPDWAYATLTAIDGGGYSMIRRDDTTFTFDSAGRIQQITDRTGQTDRANRRADGTVRSVVTDGGRTVTFTADSAGRTTAITDHAGRETTFAYDTAGDLVAVTDPTGAVSRYSYDASHLMTSLTDPTGGTIRNEFDEQARAVSQTNQVGGITTLAYEGNGSNSTTTITGAEGQIRVEEFVNSTLRSRTVAAGTDAARTTTYTVDPSSLATVAVTDALDRTVRYAYDDRGRLLSVEAADGTKTAATYDAQGNLLTAQDAAGSNATTTYDNAGRVLTQTRPGPNGPAKSTLERSSANPNDVTAVSDPLGRRTSFTHTPDGLIASSTSPLGDTDKLTYDNAGNPVTLTTAAGRTQKFTYDAAGRRTARTDAAGRTETVVYDSAGRPVASSDSTGDKTTITRDAAGQVVATRFADGRTRTDGYDLSGRLVSSTDFAGKATSYEYDAANQLIRQRTPIGTSTFSYDAAGQRTRSVDAAGNTADLTYDLQGRLSKVVYSDGTPAVTYTYDANGRRTSSTDAAGTVTTEYDLAGLERSTVDAAGARVGYAYDQAGQLTALTYPDGKKVSRGYDADGNLTRVTDLAGRAFTFGYDPDGVLLTETAPNGATTRSTLQKDGSLAETQVMKGSSKLLTLTLGQDADGLPASERTAGAGGTSNLNFAHDTTGRLNAHGTSATGDSATRFAYNEADVPVAVTSSGGRRSQLDYDPVTGILATLTRSLDGVPTATSTFAHNALGQRTTETAGQVKETFAWSQTGNLFGYTGPAGGIDSGIDAPPSSKTAAPVTAAYTYDGRGLRTSSTVAQKTTRFVYDTASSGVPRLLVAGDLRFVYGPQGRPLEQIDATGKVLYLHGDQINSTRLVTDAAGKAVQAFSYTAYGTVTVKTGGSIPATPLLWAGGYRDAESGLYYLYARYYDPATAQFLSGDPLAAVSQTAYAYAFASPLALVDPLGLFGLSLSDALGIVSTVTSIGAIVATATGVGAPIGLALTVVSIGTGVASATLTCKEQGLTAECGFAVAGSATGIAGDAIGIAAKAGKFGAVGSAGNLNAESATTLLTAKSLSFSVFYDAKAIADGFKPNASSATGTQGGNAPASPLYDPSGLCLL